MDDLINYQAGRLVNFPYNFTGIDQLVEDFIAEMEKRKLTVTLQPDWKVALRLAGKAAQQDAYQGETLNFESPGAFFSHLTERRWNIINALQGKDTMGVRELARQVGRDVKCVHEDVQALVELGLIERTKKGAVICPYTDIHVDMHIIPGDQAA